MREFFVKLSQMDRRWVFLGVGLVLLILGAEGFVAKSTVTERLFDVITEVMK